MMSASFCITDGLYVKLKCFLPVHSSVEFPLRHVNRSVSVLCMPVARISLETIITMNELGMLFYHLAVKL